MTLDLRKDGGKDVFKRLVADYDVVMDCFRPGVMEKLGLGYDALKEINKGIIYCALNAFGSTGPLRRVPAHDINIESLAGITALTGSGDGPPAFSAIQVASAAGGSLFAALAILMALINREKTGQGQFCDVSMLDGSISLLSYMLADWSGWGRPLRRGNELLNGGYAYCRVYETGDHKYMSLGISETKYWRVFCQRVGRPEYISALKTPEKQEQMIEDVQNIIKQKSRAEWIEMFSDTDMCITPVLELDEVCEHPQVVAREMTIKLENFHDSGQDMVLTGLPVKFSASPGEVKVVFSELGEHTREILMDVGYSQMEIEALMSEDVI
jgi:crotonobetainyl-CoA:carnitine CoA-transferase CaiB-like acyl-CoA transferase